LTFLLYDESIDDDGDDTTLKYCQDFYYNQANRNGNILLLNILVIQKREIIKFIVNKFINIVIMQDSLLLLSMPASEST
jgi:hypothetical protein